MDNFDLRKYLAEGRLFKEGIDPNSEIADYVESMFNSSVIEKEGFQSDIWRKEQYASNDYREGSVFLDLAKHLNSVGGKDVLEGNPDIHLELLSNGDIQWSADVTLDENLAEGRLLKEEVDYHIELLTPEIAFDVESGELADSPYEFGTEDEIEDGEVDVTTYTDADELDEFVFGRSYNQAKYFEKEYPGLFKVVVK